MNDLTTIEGLVSPAEAEKLSELASSLPDDGVIVEIGSYTGKSSCNLALSGRRLYCVDLWDMRLGGETEKRRKRKKYRFDFNSTGAFDMFRKRVEPFSNVTWIKGDSAEVAKAWSQPISLLFIDGAHDAASVTADYDGWARHVIPGGFIAFHDAHKGQVLDVIEGHVKPSGLWEGWELVQRLAVAQRTA